MNNKRELNNRSVRVFVSSTFRDMMEERSALMTHTWPELRKFCTEHHVELIEVDLRWGIDEQQCSRNETLKICLDEIRACRPYFIGLLGERYGWVPGEDAYTPDLKEEQQWLKYSNGKSVTELEILHGVLNNPDMAERAFFYFRDPAYVKGKGIDFQPESNEAESAQQKLKHLIRETCLKKNIPLHEPYSDCHNLARLVLEHLSKAIADQFPLGDIPGKMDQDIFDHEAYAEMRSRTYIDRADYFEKLDKHCLDDGPPLLITGEPGSGKSALFANWIYKWNQSYPNDYIFQHYIGCTPDGAIHWEIMRRLISEIKSWTNDLEDLPQSNDEILRDFPLWLSKARIKAEFARVRFIIVLDALNQLEEKDYGRLLGWLPEHPFFGSLRMILSTTPCGIYETIQRRGWPSFPIEPLSNDERGFMIRKYLARFGKKLDDQRINRVSAVSSAANPLYLKILLDELRVTGTYDNLDERLDDYLAAPDTEGLLQKVLIRYQRDYEGDRKALVSEVMGLLWAARRGLSETELLKLLKPANLPQLQVAIWAPLRAALEEGLTDRGGILNFAHDHLRSAVVTKFWKSDDKQRILRMILADYFEGLPASERSCDELPWLLLQAKSFKRLRICLLNIDCFIEIIKRSEEELRSYWIALDETESMGKQYLTSFNTWSINHSADPALISTTANALGFFLRHAGLISDAESFYSISTGYASQLHVDNSPEYGEMLNNQAILLFQMNRLDEAESLIKKAIKIHIHCFGNNHPKLATDFSTLANILQKTNRVKDAEYYLLRALEIDEIKFGKNHPKVALRLGNLSNLLQASSRLLEAEVKICKALEILKQNFGEFSPRLIADQHNLALIYKKTGRFVEAQQLYRQILKIQEQCFEKFHPDIASTLNNLGELLQITGDYGESAEMLKRSLEIMKMKFGPDHPNVAIISNTLAVLLFSINQFDEAEKLLRTSIRICEKGYASTHVNLARYFNNLAQLLIKTGQLSEAEMIMNKTVILLEKQLGPNHEDLSTGLYNLGDFLYSANRLAEARPLIERSLEILVKYSIVNGLPHPLYHQCLNTYIALLRSLQWSEQYVRSSLKEIGVII